MKQGKWTRITAVLFAAAMLVSLSACGDEQPPATGNPTTTTSTTTTTTAETTADTTTATTPKTTTKKPTTTTTTKKPTTTTVTNVKTYSYPVHWIYTGATFANGKELDINLVKDMPHHDYAQYGKRETPWIVAVSNVDQLKEFKQYMMDASPQDTAHIDEDYQKYDASYFKDHSLMFVFYPFEGTVNGKVVALIRQGNEICLEWESYSTRAGYWAPNYTVIEVKSADVSGVEKWCHYRSKGHAPLKYTPHTAKGPELSEQQKAEIVADFAHHLWYEEEWHQYESLEQTEQSCSVRAYYGTYRGYTALVMDVGFGPAIATEVYLAGGYYAWADGGEYYYLYRDGKFYSFNEVYMAQGIALIDIKDVWYHSHGGKVPVKGPENMDNMYIPPEELAEKMYCSATLQDDFIEGELIIGMGKSVSELGHWFTAKELSDLLGIPIERAEKSYSAYVITLPTKTKQAVLDAIKKVEASPLVRYAEPNYVIYIEYDSCIVHD